MKGLSLFMGFCSLFLPVRLAAQESDFLVQNRVLVKYQGLDRDVIIPPKLGIDRIGEKAFAGMLVNTVTLPIGIAYIDEQAFAGCTFLKQVSLPNTLVGLGRRAFFNCVFLERINIPQSLIAIGDGAFFNCRSLTEINIPDTLKTLGSRAFAGCIGLQTLSLSRRTKQGTHPFMGVRCSITYKD
jgi:hypothetical protein